MRASKARCIKLWKDAGSCWGDIVGMHCCREQGAVNLWLLCICWCVGRVAAHATAYTRGCT
eukprot:29190-Eustigmatos_ZCMA.PRE.1